MNDKLKIFSKDSLVYVGVILGILGFLIILVLIFGDDVDWAIHYIFAAGFFFILGTLFGLHRAQMQDIESKRKEKHISD